MSRVSSLFTSVAAATLCGAFLVNSASPAMAQGRLQDPNEQCGEEINYEDAEINVVVDEIAMRTGKKFVVAPQVNGTVTIKSGPNGGICPDEAWELFQAALRVSGFVATPNAGDSYNIVPIQQGARTAGPVGDEGRAGDFVTQIVRLKHIEAREAAASLAQITSERGVVNPVRSGNAVIIVDTAENVVRLRKVIAQIDRDTRVDRTIQLENASAVEVARVIEELARELSDDNGGQPASISAVAFESSNSVLVRAEPGIMARVMSIITELDRAGQTQSDLSVIPLRHADAEAMATLLREVANAESAAAAGVEPTTSAAPRGRVGQRATISVYQPTNAVIVSGDADLQRKLRRVILELDVRQPQVLVDAVIVEMSDDTARALGVQYLVSGTDSTAIPFSATNFSEGQGSVLAAAGSAFLDGGVPVPGGTTDPEESRSDFTQDLVAGALGSLLGLNGFALGGALTDSNGNIFSAIITAVQNDTESQLLSVPSVVTLDNQPARLSVGQEIPITTGEAVGNDFTNAFRTVSREEVGIILEVTPRINEGGTVTLEILQERSSVEGQIIDTSTDLITNKTTIETTALVDDGDILVIGGLIEQSEQLSEQKVPVLGDVPVFGNLFKNRGKSRDKGNLMVFIRPTIIRDQRSARDATYRKLDYIKAQELISTGRGRSEIERLIEQVTGAGPVGSSGATSGSEAAPLFDDATLDGGALDIDRYDDVSDTDINVIGVNIPDLDADDVKVHTLNVPAAEPDLLKPIEAQGDAGELSVGVTPATNASLRE